MKHGVLVTFEGIDGAGKSYQVRRFSEYLAKNGVPHIATKQPGGTPLAEEIRKIVLSRREETVFDETELLMFAAARAQHIRGIVVPALSKGMTVVCDRYMDSVYAYQAGRGHSAEMIRKVYGIVDCGVVPDLTFYLDVTPEIGFERISSGGHVCDRIEADREYQARNRAAYHVLAEQNPGRIQVLDGTLPAAKVTEEIVRIWVRSGLCAAGL